MVQMTMITKENDEQKPWEALPEIYVRLHKDELGYPPREWDQLRVEPTDEPAVLRSKNIPQCARGLSLEDEVKVSTSTEGYYPCCESVVRRSGYSPVWLRISKDKDQG